MNNFVKHPKHYNSDQSGIECWDINEHLNGNIAAVFKYVFRRHTKGGVEMNIEKAIEYLRREVGAIERDITLTDGMRKICQPGMESFLKEKLSLVKSFETERQIVRFYENLNMLIYATRPATRMVLCHTLAGGLNSYLTDLDEAAVKCTPKDLFFSVSHPSGFLDGFDSSLASPWPAGVNQTRGGSTSNTSQE